MNSAFAKIVQMAEILNGFPKQIPGEWFATC